MYKHERRTNRNFPHRNCNLCILKKSKVVSTGRGDRLRPDIEVWKIPPQIERYVGRKSADKHVADLMNEKRQIFRSGERNPHSDPVPHPRLGEQVTWSAGQTRSTFKIVFRLTTRVTPRYFSLFLFLCHVRAHYNVTQVLPYEFSCKTVCQLYTVSVPTCNYRCTLYRGDDTRSKVVKIKVIFVCAKYVKN